jgi:hypothetical protein
MAFEEIYIDRIRKSLIDDIKYTNKMSESNKIKSIDEVNSIKFICVDKETIDAVTNDKNTLGCYFKYIENEKLVKVIFLDRGRFLDTEKNDNGINRTILHELRHLVDDVIGGNNSYSEMNNVIDILDKDIISQNEKVGLN